MEIPISIFTALDIREKAAYEYKEADSIIEQFLHENNFPVYSSYVGNYSENMEDPTESKNKIIEELENKEGRIKNGNTSVDFKSFGC